MIKLRKLTSSDVIFALECLPEDTPIEGNVIATGNDAADHAAEQETRAELNAGNGWAWCCAKVTCSWKSFSAVEYLGCCSYDSENAFRTDPYFEQMCAEALDALNAQLREIAENLSALAID